MAKLDEKRISKAVGDRAKIFVFSEIDSTNSEAKRYATQGGECPAVFIAKSQSAGRGRMGRSFYSPSGTGLYFSLLVKDKGRASETLLITTLASVVIRRAILDTAGVDTGIKWVNDLYIDSKKVAGILAEAISVGDERWIVLGVGINLTTTEFPDELRGIATSLSVDVDISELATRCATELLNVWNGLYNNEELIKEYRAASIVIGRQITYTLGGQICSGVALDVDGRGRLIVRGDDGEIITLGSGEISIRFL